MKKHHLQWLLAAILLGIIFPGCKDKKKDTIEKLVTEWTGKTIVFPKELHSKFMGRDTVCLDLFDKPYKVLIYTDSTGCTSCKLRMHEWKKIIAETDTIASGQLSFLFFFNPKNEKELDFMMKRERFDYPIFVDNVNEIQQLNSFPDDMMFQTFLLDKDNKVLMIGNPASNPKIWELYKEVITGKKKQSTEKTTQIEVDKTEHDFGKIKNKSENACFFTLTNNGPNDLIINHVSASCGCTGVEWEKQPVKPGATTQIKVKMTPDEPGYFNKTVDVHCNVENGIVKLVVKGEAE